MRPTHALDGASVVGRIRRPVVDPTGHIIVRLQGVDAPELHYRPVAVLARKAWSSRQTTLFRRWCAEYRQPMGKTSTAALTAWLGAHGAVIPCLVTTAV